MISFLRGLGTISRFFAGSTSRYVMEHASCNVIVAKQPLQEKVEDQSAAVESSQKLMERAKDYIGEVPRAVGPGSSNQMEGAGVFFPP
jgi:hypothetical protein